MLKKFALLLIFLSIYLINCFSVFGSEKTFAKAEDAWKKKEFVNAKTLYEQALDQGNLKWTSKDTALVKVGWIYRWIEKDPEKGLAFVNAAYKNSKGKSAFINTILSQILFHEGDFKRAADLALSGSTFKLSKSVLANSYFALSDLGEAFVSYDDVLSVKDRKKVHPRYFFLNEISTALMSKTTKEERRETILFGRPVIEWFNDFPNLSQPWDSIYSLFKGSKNPSEVIQAISKNSPEKSRNLNLMLTHFYVGAYYAILDDERSALFHYGQAQRFGDKSFYDDKIDERKLVERMLAQGEFKRLSGHAWVLEYAPDTLSKKLHDEEQLIEQLEKQDSLTARILLADYRFEMALYGMKNYLRCQSNNSCKHPEIAEVLYHALLYAKSATELDPEDTRYWRLLGEITYRLRDDLLYRSMAIEALERVREKDGSDDPSVLIYLADLYMASKEAKEAVLVYKQLMEKFPGLISNELELVVSACMQAHLSRLCIKSLQKVENRFPYEVKSRYALARAMLHRYQAVGIDDFELRNIENDRAIKALDVAIEIGLPRFVSDKAKELKKYWDGS
jgi:hypothetical protein